MVEKIIISLEELQNLLSNKNFNPYIDVSNIDKVLLHLIEEIGELVKVYRKEGIYSDKFNMELGDCQILLLFFAISTHINLEAITLDKIRMNIADKKFQPTKEKLQELRGLFNNVKY